jgi:ribosomal protein S18 acetylase RimI-like enzyme
VIRPAVPADAEALGRVHAACWAETYPGLLPPALLARMTEPSRRIAEWRGWLADPPVPGGTDLALLDGAVVGFVSCGPAREAALGAEGEIRALYVLAAAQRRGLGRALLAAAARRLLAGGIGAVALWVIAGNTRAIAFYRALGAVEGLRRRDAIEGVPIEEVAMLWPRLEPLASGGGAASL